MDSSIRFQNQNLHPSIATARTSGIALQTLDYFNLTCYTNPRMFHWFKETEVDYEIIPTLEANIIMFHRSFLTSLVMKTWVTCALDEACIAPEGSRLANCCGCHRYDQCAITVATTFFYGYPKLKSVFFAANSFLHGEEDFFRVMRGDRLKKVYFTVEPLSYGLLCLLYLCIFVIFLMIFQRVKEKTVTDMKDYSWNMFSNFKKICM